MAKSELKGFEKVRVRRPRIHQVWCLQGPSDGPVNHGRRSYVFRRKGGGRRSYLRRKLGYPYIPLLTLPMVPGRHACPMQETRKWLFRGVVYGDSFPFRIKCIGLWVNEVVPPPLLTRCSLEEPWVSPLLWSVHFESLTLPILGTAAHFVCWQYIRFILIGGTGKFFVDICENV